jgi:hypothetical protein
VPEATTGAAHERPNVSARRVALWGAALAAALIATAVVAYHQLLHYDRRAIEHVPPGAELGLRVDLENVVLFEPVRKNLLVLVDRAPLAEGEPTAGTPPRRERLREVGLNLGLDLRELVFARVPGGGWVLALGGLFASRPLLDDIARVLKDEPGVHLRSEPPILILAPSGVVLARADDGVLLVASGPDVIARALPAGRGHENLGLDRRGAASFAALRSWFEALDPRPLRLVPIERLLARLDVGTPLQLDVRVEHGLREDDGADDASLRRALLEWLGDAPEDSLVPRADWGGERAVFARGRWNRTSEGVATLSTSWEASELDRATRSLAAWLEGRFSARRPTAR